MFKKLFLIIAVFAAYVYIISSDEKGSIKDRANNLYHYAAHKLKEMNIEIYVNKISLEKNDK